MTGDAPRLTPSLFDGRRLTLGRLYRGLRKVELASAIGVTPAAVTQYEQGRSRPSEAVLAALALRLGFPPAFFERGRPLYPIAEGQANFRRLRSTSKRDRERLLARVSLLAEITSEVERYVHLPHVEIPDIPTLPDDEAAVEEAAAAVRRRWSLGVGPIDHMVRLLETKGVFVVRQTSDIREVDAFSTVVNGRPIIVLASDKHDTARSRMDAAHELAHLTMHQDIEPGHQATERAANRFASAFLLPAETLRAELPRYLRWEAYGKLKLRWRVSLAALLYRARTLGVLSPDAFRRAQIQMSVQGWRENEPVDIGPPEEPRLLGRTLDLVAPRGLTHEALADKIRLFSVDFASLLEDATLPGPSTLTPPVL